MSKIDLHSHSKYSPDGELDPEVIVHLAKERGVHTLAITDHNSVRGVSEGLEAGKKFGVRIIPGIEIDASWNGLNLHILGLGIDHTAPVFEAIEKNAILQESKLCLQLLDGLKDLGLFVENEAELRDSVALSPELIIRKILDNPQNQKDERILPYLAGGNRSEMPVFNFYYDYCLSGKPLFIPRFYETLENAIIAIKENGGTPFLAHPGGSLTDFEKQLPDLHKMGVEGVEAFSTYHSPELNVTFAKMAKSLGMLISCGSDFHGRVKPTIQLGQVDDSLYATEVSEAVEKILK